MERRMVTTLPNKSSPGSGKRMKCHHRMLIQWSEEDQVFVVSLPEFGPYSKTHGATHEEAAKNGAQVLDLLMQSCAEDGEPLPAPVKYPSA